MPDAPTLPPPPQNVLSIVRRPEDHHALRAAQAAELANQPPGRPEATGQHHLSPHQGSVINQPRLVIVYLGTPGFDRTRYEDFVTKLCHGYFDKLWQYGYAKGPATYAGAFQGPDLGAASVTDAQIQTALSRYLQQTPAVPQPDGHTLYLLPLPAGVVVDLGGSLSCKALCGFHGSIGPATFYAVLPDTGCAGCNEGVAFDGLTAVTAHECAEAISDAVVGQGWYEDTFNGQPSGEENGDLAAWPRPLLDYAGYRVQGYFVNEEGATLGAYVAPQPTPQPQPVPAPAVAPYPGGGLGTWLNWTLSLGQFAGQPDPGQATELAQLVAGPSGQTWNEYLRGLAARA